MPEAERIRSSSGPNRPNSGRVHVSYRAVLRGWAFRPIRPEASAALAGHGPRSHAPGVFVVSEAEAAAIRTAFDQGGELSAAVELRRLFPGVTDIGGSPGVRPDHCRLETAAHEAVSGRSGIPGGFDNPASHMPGRPLRLRPNRRSSALKASIRLTSASVTSLSRSSHAIRMSRIDCAPHRNPSRLGLRGAGNPAVEHHGVECRPGGSRREHGLGHLRLPGVYPRIRPLESKTACPTAVAVAVIYAFIVNADFA